MELSGWFWASFADPDLPKGTRFLGAAVLPANDVGTAAMVAHAMGINPGGEVAGAAIPTRLLPDEGYRNRLLSRDEAQEVSDEMDEKWRASGERIG